MERACGLDGRRSSRRFRSLSDSCEAWRKMRRSDDRGQISRALSSVCRKAQACGRAMPIPRAPSSSRTFNQLRIARIGEAEGLLTGYFEPIVAGSRFPSPEFLSRSIAGRMIGRSRLQARLPCISEQGRRSVAATKTTSSCRTTTAQPSRPARSTAGNSRSAGSRIRPTCSRSRSKALGRVILEDGTPLRVSLRFAQRLSLQLDRARADRAQYSSRAGRFRRSASATGWPRIRTRPRKIRAANRSYVFFRVTGLTNDGEPVGAQGVPLTPGRSIAVDRVHRIRHAVFHRADLPIEGGKAGFVLPPPDDRAGYRLGDRRTGSRRSLLGAGDEAGHIAGRIRHPGRFVMLLPREVDLVAAGGGRRCRRRNRGSPSSKSGKGRQGGVRRYRQARWGWPAAAQSPPARPFHRRSPNRRSRCSASRRRTTGARLRSKSKSRTTRARPILPMPARAQPAGRYHRLCQTQRSPCWTARNRIANARQTGRTPARARPASPSCCRC